MKRMNFQDYMIRTTKDNIEVVRDAKSRSVDPTGGGGGAAWCWLES